MKNTRFKNLLNFFIGLLFIVIASYFFVSLIMKFSNWVREFSSNTDAVIVVALITGLLSLLGIVVSNIIDYRQNTKRYLYEKKEEAYSEFIEMVYKLQQAQNDDKVDDEMVENLINFSKKLTLWGSDDVIKKWIEIRKLSLNTNNDPVDNIFILEEIIFLIRKDLGQKNKGLKKGDILVFFINDIDKYLQKKD